MRKGKSLLLIGAFMIISTICALYFQWSEFIDGYSLSSSNTIGTIIFIVLWLIFSFYLGKKEDSIYKGFAIAYGCISIITAILTSIFATADKFGNLVFNTDVSSKILNALYIWFYGPLYGFKMPHIYDISNIALFLIVSSIIMIISLFGYTLGKSIKRVSN